MIDSEPETEVSFTEALSASHTIDNMQSLSDGPSNTQVEAVIRTLDKMCTDLLPRYKYEAEQESLYKNLIQPLTKLVKDSESKDKEMVKWSDLEQTFDRATLAALDKGFVFTDTTAKMWLYSSGIVEASSFWKGCQDYRRWLKKNRHVLTQDEDVTLSTVNRDFLRFHPQETI